MTLSAIGPCQTVACFERHRQLLQEFAQIVSEYQRMQRAELTAILNGKDFLFDDWITEATVRMEQAKLAVLTFRQAHG